MIQHDNCSLEDSGGQNLLPSQLFSSHPKKLARLTRDHSSRAANLLCQAAWPTSLGSQPHPSRSGEVWSKVPMGRSARRRPCWSFAWTYYNRPSSKRQGRGIRGWGGAAGAPQPHLETPHSILGKCRHQDCSLSDTVIEAQQEREQPPFLMRLATASDKIRRGC